MSSRARQILAGLCLAAMAAGCETGAQADKTYRQLLDAREQVVGLQQANQQLQATARDQQEQIARLADMGPNRLDKIFHVVRVDLSRYSGGVNLDNQPGDDAIRVFLDPVDQAGDTLKAAGDVTIELFDLASPPERNLLGKCHWDVGQAAKQWAGGLFSNHYNFLCPWQSPPQHAEITVRAVFVDYLTGKSFTAQMVCKINLPPASQPASQAASQATTKPGNS